MADTALALNIFGIALYLLVLWAWLKWNKVPPDKISERQAVATVTLTAVSISLWAVYGVGVLLIAAFL